MTLLEQTYTGLRQAGLVGTAEAFSTNYLGKNKNWYSYQTHMRRDMTLGAAVQCARSLRLFSTSEAALTGTQNSVISATLRAIEQHLAERYMVTALADAAVH
jgi:hypothetical protein